MESIIFYIWYRQGLYKDHPIMARIFYLEDYIPCSRSRVSGRELDQYTKDVIVGWFQNTQDSLAIVLNGYNMECFAWRV